jgi:hypothetical protein
MGCKHLGDDTGEVKLIRCPTCTGNVRKKYPIFACAVHGECLPTYDGIANKVMPCGRCKNKQLGYEPAL